ncbi:ubiquinone biosynthesis regulatory protein kinase UbiB [Porticoccaceae bacterium]|nr:ubiquinone biosynthesis regulatory protein kinase UbiB [Porticoccaceae bacterium]
MSQLRRLAKIYYVVGKYRLDNLIDQRRLPLAVRLALAPSKLFGNSQLSRGQRLRLALEELGPIFIKFGQLLSTRPDLVAPDICAEIKQLQDNVAPFSSEIFTANVEAALEGKVEDIFAEFDQKPLATASIAQVHKATLKDGTEVVVKSIRPHIEKTISRDIALLYSIAKWVAKYSIDGPRLKPVEVVKDYEKVIFGELNLQSEGANASLLKHNFKDSPLLHVPQIHWPYSNQNVLVMERISGIPVTNIDDLKAAGVNFKNLAERGVEIFFTQVFDHNFFHADMHPGNIFVDASNAQNPRYIAIDCAIMGSLTREDQFYMARNLLAIFKRDYTQVAELHVRSGWVPKDTSIAEFTTAIRSVCEPIFERPLGEISLGHMLVSLFSTARQFNMEVQPSLVLLQKTLLNIEGLGRQLYPELDLWATAQPYLERWLKDRYSPKAIFKQLKNDFPDLLEKLPQVPPMLFQALENLQTPANEQSSIPTPAVKSRKMHSTGAVIAGLGLGLLATQWLTAMGPTLIIGSAITACGALLMLFK